MVLLLLVASFQHSLLVQVSLVLLVVIDEFSQNEGLRPCFLNIGVHLVGHHYDPVELVAFFVLKTQKLQTARDDSWEIRFLQESFISHLDLIYLAPGSVRGYWGNGYLCTMRIKVLRKVVL